MVTRRHYDFSALELACKAVREGNMTIREAERFFSVPYTTLHSHIDREARGVRDHRPHIGVMHALDDEEELFVVDLLENSATAGFPLTVAQLQLMLRAQFPGRVDGRNCRWSASAKWVYAFLQRHADRIHLTECVPVKRTPAHADPYAAVRDTYAKFNRFLRNHTNPRPLVFAFDETNINLTAATAAHQKVIGRKGTKPFLYLSDQDRYLTLAIFICEDGSVVCPTLIHPQSTRIPQENIAAWDNHSGGADTLHIAAGRTAFMNKFFFYQVFHRFAELVRCVLPRTTPVVCLVDGCSAHYNVRTALDLAQDNIYLFVYSSQITKYLAPPDDHAVFGAFQRCRRRELATTGGAASLAVGIAGAARAFATALKPRNVRSAFLSRGFAQTESRLRAQARVKDTLLAIRRSTSWLEDHAADEDYSRMFHHHPFHHHIPQGHHLSRERRPLGVGVPATGFVNSPIYIPALLEELHRVVAAGEE